MDYTERIEYLLRHNRKADLLKFSKAKTTETLVTLLEREITNFSYDSEEDISYLANMFEVFVTFFDKDPEIKTKYYDKFTYIHNKIKNLLHAKPTNNSELVDKLNQIASSSLYISYCENYIKTVDELYQRCTKQKSMNKIKNVIFNNPATIVFWSDGSKTVVKCGEGDTFDPEKGLAMAISKKFFDNKGYYCDIFKKWLPKNE